ncbi:YdcF family protein [Photobacterium frigidiphilum]|uniref:YdcF family protein n=1 Tax=Photobacterium frigidiphilum TaxID=264736 RepID=A0A2T3J7C7_9GAMM|nr:YdcF family protein [Photobacterium frigidiphilum]PSU44620.1 YdcF family protein [Photobacterium frigidiphilum]
MSFIALSLILLLIFFVYLMRWRKASFCLSFFLVVIFAFIGTGVIPQYLLERLQVNYEVKPVIHWTSKNAIVLLGAGTQKIKNHQIIEPTFFSYSRISETASQYNSCEVTNQICKVIISGGDVQNNGISEAEAYKHALVKLGIKANDIITESNSMNTWKNAEFTSKIIKMNKFNNVVLVSSGLHMRRSELYFKHFGVIATPVRSDYMAGKPSLLPLWYNFAVTDFALHEYIGYIRYDVYNIMGWNNQRQDPGDA